MAQAAPHHLRRDRRPTVTPSAPSRCLSFASEIRVNERMQVSELLPPPFPGATLVYRGVGSLRGVRVRPYRDEDAGRTLEIYERAVHLTAARDYSPEQLAAWAPLDRDTTARADWAKRRAAARTLVAVEGERIAGFSDLVGGTLVDMLFVDPTFGGRGVGSLLIETIVALAQDAQAPYLETHASLTAKPVFERHGFVAVSQEAAVIRGVELTNFKMRRSIGGGERRA